MRHCPQPHRPVFPLRALGSLHLPMNDLRLSKPALGRRLGTNASQWSGIECGSVFRLPDNSTPKTDSSCWAIYLDAETHRLGLGGAAAGRRRRRRRMAAEASNTNRFCSDVNGAASVTDVARRRQSRRGVVRRICISLQRVGRRHHPGLKVISVRRIH